MMIIVVFLLLNFIRWLAEEEYYDDENTNPMNSTSSIGIASAILTLLMNEFDLKGDEERMII